MRLLLAEDERDLSRALTAVLEHNAYQVDAVDNGEDALRLLCSEPYDIAVLDIMMPRMDGLTALRTARKQGVKTPAIFLTARSLVDDRVEGLECGADDYLTKPFAMKELLARIRVILRRNGVSAQAEQFLRFEDIILNQDTCTLICGSQTERLTNKEYQMMVMLMQHPGMVISTEQFMDTVWGMDSDAELNVVWTYLSRLRKRLTAMGAHVQISTSRGLGYYLEASHD